MSLESAFARLALRPSTFCRQCQRNITTAPPQRQAPQSSTAAFTQTLQASREQNASPASSQRSSKSFDLAARSILESTSKSTQFHKTQAQRDAERTYSAKDLSQQIPRRWKAGDVYAPHDLSGVEMSKWKKLRRKPRPKYDVLDQLGVNPLDHYKNFSIMSEYITPMGRIRHSNDTGLRPVNQRKMAKAIRRAMGMGLMPGVHRHPELLKMEMRNQR
ncbi:mitochondrial 37S ribosomal protein RSM18 [Zymoseptoria brevis]|uniref:Small ribosomal subunit protein bS18m n=2 Tax=Zymoseptoria TaxID=1047167 RepID=A0A0F4GC87_9PEZI|nr:mitochondrial 37S ribosomal protein RSM18 [Zymoseptoria brevis]